MTDAALSLKQLNRTFIGSVLFIDIVGYSMRTVPDQLEMKELFNKLLSEAVQNVAPSDRIMVDTGDGAGIAFLGDPEDALFAALSLRDAVESGTVPLGEPGFVRMGINLGPLKIVRDINGHTNMIGDAVNDAQRVMSFAEPGQVMVSHSYYDIISRFSRDYTQLFTYEGTRHDKHVREHEIYRFGPVKDNESLAEKLRDRSRARGAGAAEASHAASAAAQAVAAPAKASVPTAKKAIPHVGLIATLVSTVTLVGAVWSWTSKPEQKPDSKTAAIAALSSEEEAPAAKTSTAAEKVASKPAEPKMAKQPEATNASASASASEKASQSASVPQVALAVESAAAADKAAKAAEASAPPAKPGTVKLAIQPWGEIYVDGGKRGISPPLKSLNLAPGKHKIEIRNGEFAPYKETIEVKSGAETTVQYVF